MGRNEVVPIQGFSEPRLEVIMQLMIDIVTKLKEADVYSEECTIYMPMVLKQVLSAHLRETIEIIHFERFCGSKIVDGYEHVIVFTNPFFLHRPKNPVYVIENIYSGQPRIIQRQ